VLKRLLLFAGTLTAVAVGSVGFAAFESHIINVKAHVEKATFVTPDEIDFGVALMQVKYDKGCIPGPDGPNNNGTGYTGTCMKIHLSASFKDPLQTAFEDVEYEIWCEVKSELDPDDLPYGVNRQITPYITLTDSDNDVDGAVITSGDPVVDTNDNGDGDTAVPGSCQAPALPAATKWVNSSTLLLGSDEVDLWDMQFFAPLCSDNYNPFTDPDQNVALIDSAYCTDGPGPNSDEYVNLGSDVKFQIIGFSPKGQ